MSTHPDHYRDLLRRRFAGDPSLAPAERKELDLHLLICPECNYDYAHLLLPRAQEAAEGLLQGLERGLTADLVAPYLPELARAIHDGHPLDGFQQMLWRFICTDHQALGHFRLAEAHIWWQERDP